MLLSSLIEHPPDVGSSDRVSTPRHPILYASDTTVKNTPGVLQTDCNVDPEETRSASRYLRPVTEGPLAEKQLRAFRRLAADPIVLSGQPVGTESQRVGTSNGPAVVREPTSPVGRHRPRTQTTTEATTRRGPTADFRRMVVRITGYGRVLNASVMRASNSFFTIVSGSGSSTAKCKVLFVFV
jgi:hypothetical protein